MAGSYPDVPSHRIPYDVDGTVVWQAATLSGGSFGGGGYYTGMVVPPSELLSTAKTLLNDENSTALFSDGGPAARDYGWGWIWPEKRDIFGFFGWAMDSATPRLQDLESSTESRNMITKGSTDGVFNTLASVPVQPPGNDTWSVEQSYREYVGAYTSTGATGVRVRLQTSKTVGAAVDKSFVAAFHWYGDISDGANPDRIIFIDADSGLAFDETHDWGDKPRGSVHFQEFWIVNNSATLTATSNVFTFEDISELSNEWYDLRDNSTVSTAYSTTITINGPIAAGARYPATTTFTIRQTIADDEDLGPASARMRLFTGTWA